NLAVRVLDDLSNLTEGFVIRAVDGHAHLSHQALQPSLHSLPQDRNDGLARWREGCLLLRHALSNTIRIATKLANLVPAHFRDALRAAFNPARNALQRQLAPATELISECSHTHREPTGSRCDVATKLIDVVTAGVRDGLDRVSHTTPEIES